MRFRAFAVPVTLLLALLGRSWAATPESVTDTAVTAPSSVQLSTSEINAISDIEELDRPVQMVEQEFDPTLLDNLTPPPTEPLPQTRVAPIIIEKDQWHGSLCGIARPAQVVIRNPVTWDKLWTLAIRPYGTKLPETPAVDFGKNMVVGVFMGGKLYPGYAIEITSVKEEHREPENVLVVKCKNISKMQPVFSPPFAISPFFLKRIPAYNGRVVFEQASR